MTEAARTRRPWVAGITIIMSGALAMQAGVPAAAERRAAVLGVTTAEAVAEAPPSPGEGQAVEEAQNGYRYNAEGRRDPFESLIQEAPPVAEPGPVVEPTRPRGPLERFDLATLTLSGIIWGELGRRAIIRAPDGKGYFITVGMYMGQNGGRIVSIQDDRVVIVEKHRDARGNIFDKMLTIPLRRKENQQG